MTRCAAALAVVGLTITGISAAAPVRADFPGPPPNASVTPPEPIVRSWQVPWLTIDRSHPNRLAIAYQEGEKREACWLALSSDAGSTWRNLPVVGQGAPAPLPRSGQCYVPRVEFTPGGGLVYAFELRGCCLDHPIPLSFYYADVFLMTAATIDAQFSPPVFVDSLETLTRQPPMEDGDPNLAVDPNTAGGPARIYVAFQHWSLGDEVERASVAMSDDGGQTFHAPATASPATTLIASQLMGTAVDAGGTLYLAYIDYTATFYGAVSAPVTVEVTTSTDHGASFSTPATLATLPNLCTSSGCPEGYPSIGATAGAAGQAVVTWTASAGSSTCATTGTCPAPHAVLASTSTGGSSWSASRPVPAPAGKDGDWQYLPAVRLAPSGRLDVAYYDKDARGIQDTYLTSAPTASADLGPPRRISSASSDTSVTPPAGFGSTSFSYNTYLGLVAQDTGTSLAWTDTRNGTTGNAHQDVFFASTGAAPQPPFAPGLPNTGAAVGSVPAGAQAGTAYPGMFTGAGCLSLVICGCLRHRRAVGARSGRPRKMDGWARS